MHLTFLSLCFSRLSQLRLHRLCDVTFTRKEFAGSLWVGCDNESGRLVEPYHWKNTTVTYKEDELAAAPGQRRFFASGPGTLCSGGVPATAKFSVECLA